jgi:serine/threonine protein kinase
MKPVHDPALEQNSSAPPTLSLALNAGDVVAGFRIVRELGSGGASRVYLAEDQTGSRQVALKVSRDVNLESAALWKLDHPGIVALYSQQEWQSLHVLAMHYVPGPSLAECLEPTGGKPRVFPGLFPKKKREFAGRVVLEVAMALEHAHLRGIWHLDVKPENILLTESGRAVLIDFNAAQFADAEANSSRKVLGGTLAYMSPEQLAQVSGTRSDPAESRLDFRSDIYSLGAVFYELLTGRQLFPVRSGPRGMIESARETLADRLHADWLRSQLPVLPKLYRRVIAKCLAPLSAPRPEQARYESTSDLVSDLQDVQSGRLPRHAATFSPEGSQFHSLKIPPRGVAALVVVLLLVVSWAGYKHWRISDGIDQVDRETQAVLENPAAIGGEFSLQSLNVWEARLHERSWIETRDLRERRLRAEHHLAMAAIAGGQHERAVVILERILAEHPQRAEAWHNLGIARFHLKDYSSAAAAFQLALESGADAAEVLAARAAAYGAMSQFDQARADIERARRINPSSIAVNRQWELLKAMRLESGQ